ncbi:hypothetical protein BU15DRAFT_62442 [Melanogaster broomeanus]|nr:hypothetical protein BU15DRAFT_62442 [Melanogaster broomeanus]
MDDSDIDQLHSMSEEEPDNQLRATVISTSDRPQREPSAVASTRESPTPSQPASRSRKRSSRSEQPSDVEERLPTKPTKRKRHTKGPKAPKRKVLDDETPESGGEDEADAPSREISGHSIIKYLVHSSDPQRALAQISSFTPAFLAGSILNIAGSLLRIHCYRVLGRMFTFELSIRQDHKLVTSGPYSVVRHPSYTGGIVMGLGGSLCMFDRGSWLVACSGLVPGLDAESRLTNVLACTWVSMVVAVCIGMMQRMRNEDDMLEKNFGEQWKEWVRRVPYRVVPWVY